MQALWAQTCVDADPTSEMAKVYGDYELTLDTHDPEQHMLIINHIDNGPSNIVIARIDGRTGQIEAGSLTTIADNFDGQQLVNGPEFVLPPGGGLGVLYRGTDGVHGVFRPTAPKVWNDFSLDVIGSPTGKSPPLLPSSYAGTYENGGLPLNQYTYTQITAPCSARCFGTLRWGVPTDAAAVLSQAGLMVPSIEALVQSPRDGTIFAEACAAEACGIYEATINNAGGFLPGTLRLLAHVTAPAGPGRAAPMAAALHPSTGRTVLFVGGTDTHGETVDVWEQQTYGGELHRVASVPVVHSDHYRVIDNGEELVLHYLIRNGVDAGSYTIPVKASGGRLRVGASKLVATAANGAELAYLPAARQFAIFYRISRQPSLIQRCWVVP